MKTPRALKIQKNQFDLNEAQLFGLGARLAPHLSKGDYIALSGAIGTGKTTFARAIIQSRLSACGVMEDIPSPTFTLVQIYDLGETELWHFDLYRIGSTQEAYEIGLFDALECAICVIEWPECLGSDALTAGLQIKLDHIANPRHRRLSASGPKTLMAHFDAYLEAELVKKI